MTIKYLVLAGFAVLPLFSFSPAEAGGRYCREYTEDVWIGGRRHSAYGTACLQPDGSWEKISYRQEPYHDASRYNTVRYVPVAPAPVVTRNVVYQRPVPWWHYSKRPHWGHDRHDHDRGRHHGHKGHHDGHRR